MTQRIRAENIAVVLNRPRYPENIGAAARAVCNMGMGKLVVVRPEIFDLTRILKMATHAAAEVVEQMDRCDDLETALSSYRYIVGTTARMGRQRQAVHSPREMASLLVSISQENRVAVLFGAEDRGLSNEALQYCQALIRIPTAAFSSLNLAQAVMIVCYEFFAASCESESPAVPRLAERHELEGMYAQLKDLLIRVDFLNPENPDYWMNNMRRFFNRLPLRAKEVRIIRGICRQIDWYAGKRPHPPK
jgi:tRNA/rRNA methyltransferase